MSRTGSTGRAGNRPALLVVDPQVGVLAGAWRRDETIAAVSALIGRARATGSPVIWVRHDDEWLPAGSGQWQIVPELAPMPDEPVIAKNYGDAFAGTGLEQLLARSGAGGIVLCGAQSDACIRSTLNGALYRGIPVTLAADAHTTVDRRAMGAGFGPEHAVELVNLMAAYTVLPGIGSRLAPAAELFAS
ncbi:isochorismatase family protein [uncultured Propionibacterium sp.]|uniref:isochorismatase family protein n=1 Tax=uncultured Propionibacterium sp. TaxID=218066 RepID=UPI00292DC916|nr:isochorismatase family protein [uncultured Propionibacterium sp.]